jgi:hypothetical protein
MNLYWWIIFPLLVLFAILIQTQIFLNYDLLYLTHAAKQLLAGGNYLNDFFETNPPLILFLYMPPLLLSEFISISLKNALLIYFILFALTSILVSAYLLKKIMPKDSLFYSIIISAITFAFLYLPEHQLGQREFLLMIFTLPYLMSAVLRIENKPLPPYLMLGIGLFAAAGIALKPFFLALPILIESYIIYKKKSLFAAFRIETLVIAAFLLVYLWTVFHYFSDYVNVILPFVSRVYFLGMKATWSTYFSKINILFSFVPIILYFMTRKIDRYPTLSTVFLLALIAFIISFTIPRSLFFYHILPAFGTACILFAILLGQIASDVIKAFHRKPKLYVLSDCIVIFGTTLIILVIPLFYISYFYTQIAQARTDIAARNMFDFFNHQAPNNTFTCFSISSDYRLLEYYSSANYVGPSTFFWWEFGFLKLKDKLKEPSALTQLKKDELFIGKLITDNLTHKKPRYILLDDKAGEWYIHRNIDYIAELSQYKPFLSTWKKYHYKTTIGRFRIYELNKV